MADTLTHYFPDDTDEAACGRRLDVRTASGAPTCPRCAQVVADETDQDALDAAPLPRSPLAELLWDLGVSLNTAAAARVRGEQ